jgi:hypothetical protein
LFAQIEQAAGSGHENLDALPQHADLRVLIDAAEDRANLQSRVNAIGREILGNLLSQLARTGQNEDLNRSRLAGLSLALTQHVQQRQGKRGRLAGSRLSAADHISAGEDRRDCLFLDRGRLGITFVADRAEQPRGEPKIFK